MGIDDVSFRDTIVKIFITILILTIIYLLFLLSERDPYNPETFGGMKEMANTQNVSSHIGDIKGLVSIVITLH